MNEKQEKKIMVCPKCGKSYDSSWEKCLHCNVPLEAKKIIGVTQEPAKDERAEKRELAIFSIVFLIINLIALFVFTKVLMIFTALIEDLGPLSGVAKLAQSGRYIFIIIGLVLIAKEFLKKKSVTLMINIVALIIVFFLYMVLLFFGPINQLNQLIQLAK